MIMTSVRIKKHFWSNCTLLDPRFKSLKNILGLTNVEKTGSRAAFDSMYRVHWSPDLELSVLDSDDGDDDVAIVEPPTRNETAVCVRCSTVDLVSFLNPVGVEA